MNTDKHETFSSVGRKLIPVTKWNEHHPWPPIGGLRYLIFHSETNGFCHCIRRVGRKVLIDETRFFEWVDGLDDNNKRTLSIMSRGSNDPFPDHGPASR